MNVISPYLLWQHSIQQLDVIFFQRYQYLLMQKDLSPNFLQSQVMMLKYDYQCQKERTDLIFQRILMEIDLQMGQQLLQKNISEFQEKIKRNEELLKEIDFEINSLMEQILLCKSNHEQQEVIGDNSEVVCGETEGEDWLKFFKENEEK